MIFGIFSIRQTPSERITAGMIATAAFFAPLMRTVPQSLFPPLMTICFKLQHSPHRGIYEYLVRKAPHFWSNQEYTIKRLWQIDSEFVDYERIVLFYLCNKTTSLVIIIQTEKIVNTKFSLLQYCHSKYRFCIIKLRFSDGFYAKLSIKKAPFLML